MEVTVSQKTARQARAYKLTPEQLAFADLVALGWPEEDAWAVAIRTGVTWTKSALKDEINKLASADNTQRRIAEDQQMLRKSEIDKIKSKIEAESDEILERATNKELKLIELQTILEGLKPGSSEFNKINDQIFAITQMKKDEVKTDEKTVHYYLPVSYPTSCEDCLFSNCDKCKYKKAYNRAENENAPGLSI